MFASVYSVCTIEITIKLYLKLKLKPTYGEAPDP